MILKLFIVVLFQWFRLILVVVLSLSCVNTNNDLDLSKCHTCFGMFTHCLDQVPCSFKGAKHYSNLAAVLLKITRTCNLEPKESIISTTTSRTATTTSTIKPCPVCPVTQCTPAPTVKCDDCDSCCDDCPVCEEPIVEECPECPSVTPCPPATTCPTLSCPTVMPCPTFVPTEPTTPCPTVECSTPASPPTSSPCEVCQVCATEKTEVCDWGCPGALETCEKRVEELGTSNITCHNESLALVSNHIQLIKNLKVENDKECGKRIEPLEEKIQTLTTANR